jgi:hypothetical protein
MRPKVVSPVVSMICTEPAARSTTMPRSPVPRSAKLLGGSSAARVAGM